MNILVTGGAGYIGSSLVEQLNELGEVQTIFVLDNLSRSPIGFFLGNSKLSKVEFVKGDILDAYVLDKLVDKVDIIYHLAGYVSSPYNYAQNVQYEQINQWGTLNLVRCIQQSKHTIQQLIYLSSASVYGLKGVIDPQEEPQPTNAYGKSKLAGERFVRLLENNCEVKIIRAANVFGFNNSFRVDSVLNNFIFHGLVDGKILIYGDGTQKRPFVALTRCVKQLLQAFLKRGEKSSIISHVMQFNADLNSLKNWLIENHLPELEYTYINKNIDYEGQIIMGLSSMQTFLPELQKAFSGFQANIRIKNK